MNIFHLSAERVRAIDTPAPSTHQQRAISDFLDAETARIDALVDRSRDLGSRIRERATAQIHQLVQDLRIVRLKRVADVLPGYAFASDSFSIEAPGDRLLRGVNVGVESINWEDAVRLSVPVDPAHERYRVQEGDVVIGMDRPFVGGGTRVAQITAEDAGSLLVQRVCRFRFIDAAQATLSRVALSGHRFLAHVEHSLTGVSVPHLSDSQIGDLKCQLRTRALRGWSTVSV